MTSNIRKRTMTLLCALVLLFMPCLGALGETAAEQTTYITRKQGVSAFVQSVGRNNLVGSAYMLLEFDDIFSMDLDYLSDYTKAATNGIVRLDRDQQLRPDEPLTRFDALLMLAYSLQLESADVELHNVGKTEELPEDMLEAETLQDPIVYSDVPQDYVGVIDSLSVKGYMADYPAGELGVDELVTQQELDKLIAICDGVYNTVEPAHSYYGYINQKAFRNADLNKPSVIDALHGAVILNYGSWSYMLDVQDQISERETEMLTSLMNGDLAYEQGTPEQRVHDLLECIAAEEKADESDMAKMSTYRAAIADAQTVAELIRATNDIYEETGIATLLSVTAGSEFTTNTQYPLVGLVSVGAGGVLNYYSAIQEANGEIYAKTLGQYGEACGFTVTDEDIQKAVQLQEVAEAGKNLIMQFYSMLNLKVMIGYGTMAELLAPVLAEHPEIDPATYALLESTVSVHDSDEADNSILSVALLPLLNRLGFQECEKVLFSDDEAMNTIVQMLSDESYLTALKLNATLALSTATSVDMDTEEASRRGNLETIGMNSRLLEQASEDDLNSMDMAGMLEEFGVGSEDESILSTTNLSTLQTLLPNDVGSIYCKYYYDDETSEVIAQMVEQIWDAYIKRFASNTWMSAETKEKAIEKITNMIAVIGYEDNAENPEILSAVQGGTMFKNTIALAKNALQIEARKCTEPNYSRTLLVMAPDTLNACYIPEYNSMNIFAGFLEWPMYDKDATYAQNLGAIGSVIGHEIGHAFDANGAKYDKNGCLQNWWTEEDYASFKELQANFVKYYQNFEVIGGVVQDSEITITENMADFAGLVCIMDIIGDDPAAQKEALEAYARMWAQLGTATSLTDSAYLTDVHSSNGVRVNACVASLDIFYELYDITVDDAMYVAPEDRLKLW